ncbi:glycosyltransferase [Halapricum desulfuricans]|uniref:Glycosyl transferase family 2 n=1 Tax=Halapricum desulfuricans TaxID=2841257 RepID=A0A897N3R7_9EURY|nr:glycosyltransferase family 2 protein [Halapricum desulfuricans]QSG06858.1 Glycosyl transferase family 2 [Halapricum desulfuricans]
MPSARRSLRALVGIGFVLATVALSLFGDLTQFAPPLGVLLVLLETRVLLGVALAVFALSLALYLVSLSREDPEALVRSGRSVEAVIPVYDEPEVLHQSVDRLLDSSYEDLTVTVVCEPDDQPTIDRAAELTADADRARYVINGRPGSKAGALNDAIERSDADVVALFDADQQPHPDLIAHGMAALEAHDIARVRSLPRPGGLLESMVYYEYLLLFFLPQKLARFLLGLGFVGTRSVLIERSVFEAVGYFDEDALTEDMDFTHRCHRADLSIRELLYYPCFEEPAHTLRDWWGQRVRWLTGHVAVCHRHLRGWRHAIDTDFLSSTLTLVGTFVAGIVLSMTLPKLVVAATASPVLVASGVGGIYGLALVTRVVDNHTAGIDGLGLGWLLMPVALTLFGLVVVRVIVGYALGQRGQWYQVEKRGCSDPDLVSADDRRRTERSHSESD